MPGTSLPVKRKRAFWKIWIHFRCLMRLNTVDETKILGKLEEDLKKKIVLSWPIISQPLSLIQRPLVGIPSPRFGNHCIDCPKFYSEIHILTGRGFDVTSSLDRGPPNRNQQQSEMMVSEKQTKRIRRFVCQQLDAEPDLRYKLKHFEVVRVSVFVTNRSVQWLWVFHCR